MLLAAHFMRRVSLVGNTKLLIDFICLQRRTFMPELFLSLAEYIRTSTIKDFNNIKAIRLQSRKVVN